MDPREQAQGHTEVVDNGVRQIDLYNRYCEFSNSLESLRRDIFALLDLESESVLDTCYDIEQSLSLVDAELTDLESFSGPEVTFRQQLTLLRELFSDLIIRTAYPLFIELEEKIEFYESPDFRALYFHKAYQKYSALNKRLEQIRGVLVSRFSFTNPDAYLDPLRQRISERCHQLMK